MLTQSPQHTTPDLASLEVRLKALLMAFESLPENGAGEAYGDLLDEIAAVKSAIHRCS